MILFILPIKTSTNSKEKLFWDFIKSTHKYHHINGTNPSRFIPSPVCVIMVVIIFVSLTHLLIFFAFSNACFSICQFATVVTRFVGPTPSVKVFLDRPRFFRRANICVNVWKIWGQIKRKLFQEDREICHLNWCWGAGFFHSAGQSKPK